MNNKATLIMVLVMIGVVILAAFGVCLTEPGNGAEGYTLILVDETLRDEVTVIDNVHNLRFQSAGIDETGLPEYTVRVFHVGGDTTVFNVNFITTEKEI